MDGEIREHWTLHTCNHGMHHQWLVHRTNNFSSFILLAIIILSELNDSTRKHAHFNFYESTMAKLVNLLVRSESFQVYSIQLINVAINHNATYSTWPKTTNDFGGSTCKYACMHFIIEYFQCYVKSRWLQYLILKNKNNFYLK